jgi:hypothetical protein
VQEKLSRRFRDGSNAVSCGLIWTEEAPSSGFSAKNFYRILIEFYFTTYIYEMFPLNKGRMASHEKGRKENRSKLGLTTSSPFSSFVLEESMMFC